MFCQFFQSQLFSIIFFFSKEEKCRNVSALIIIPGSGVPGKGVVSLVDGFIVVVVVVADDDDFVP